MMKKLFSSLLLAGSLSLCAQQVQNPGFENWTNGFPNNWGSISQMVIASFSVNPNTEVQTASAHSGNYAVLMQNQYMATVSSYIPGEVNTGPVTFDGVQPVRGFQAYNSKPVSFDFWYKFNALGGDNAGVVSYLTKWNSSSNKRDTLAIGGSLLGLATVYTHTIIPINWLNNTLAPDSIQMHFSSSDQQVGGTNQPPAGGQLYVDDINYTLAVGMQTISDRGEFVTVYPNPSSHVLNISKNNLQAKEARIYDLTGDLVGVCELSDKVTRVDLSAFENGVYIYVVRDEKTGHIFTSKFSVEK